MTCSACGATVENGRFCSSCGASLSPSRCPSCDAEIAAGSRFCQSCGQAIGTAAGGGKNRALPWVIAGATVAAVSAVLLVRMTSSPDTSGPVAAASAAAPDISNMSPRERADRLFNRVMTAVEQGDTAQVRFFIPMALQSYQLMGDLDPDARYHLGLIQVVNHDLAGAQAQADSILRSAPGHLLGQVLQIQVATIRHDSAAIKRGYRNYLASYDKQIALKRPEYADHEQLLQHTRDEARKVQGSKGT